MQRLWTTVVCVVGPEADRCVRAFDDAQNVAAVIAPAADARQRAVEVWQYAVRSRSLFTMHDADPLEPVVDVWGERFAGGPRGDLELAVAETLARWRSNSIGLPDFYLVLSPEELSESRRAWYLGVLHRAAPHRVVPVEAEHLVVRDTIAALGAGRWWPSLDAMLDDIEAVLPDRAMLPGHDGHVPSERQLLR